MTLNEREAFLGFLRAKGVIKVGWNSLGVLTNLVREAGCTLSYNDIELMHEVWMEKAKAQAVPEGYVLVTMDQAKDTARLDFMLQEPRLVTTDINYDENYDKTGEGFCVNAVYWISGWERLTETVHQTKREAIDEVMVEASESGVEE
ncbi:hypothetical protein MSG66_18205 [Acinetobacter sp. IK31]|uniref:hypothetical protein n=1 Tax=Acinetobacter sp. IK31 TaxID=2928895 RepID=UPI002D201C40|nr:hypothetical protein [Acinetobacter sp. IK31]MEB3865938.1 hypothetical protein [Acinetobacter sp. IK31]